MSCTGLKTGDFQASKTLSGWKQRKKVGEELGKTEQRDSAAQDAGVAAEKEEVAQEKGGAKGLSAKDLAHETVMSLHFQWLTVTGRNLSKLKK